MGYGLIHVLSNKMNFLDIGVLKLPSDDDHGSKLKKIFERTVEIIELHKPDELAIEAPFFGKNVQSMLKLGRAQGVAIAAALYKNIPIFEYSPKKIKLSITGNGNSSKEQIAAMLHSLLKIDQEIKYLDATDGLAAAVCHHFQSNSPIKTKTFSGWKSFLNENPNKIAK
ncbi:MAG: crossover junction endodeoxyribonuclease RuvC [Bacteroidetes bacterium]|nr:crossover junction endodeoxyribonuclease RuvC [Bacteroidota bacterium]